MSTYEQLVEARKSCTKCAGLINPADPSHAHLDGDEIGPWSRWLASRPAKLILVGQDWGTAGYFLKYNGRDLTENLTNGRLTEFLAFLGFKVGPADRTDKQSRVFATNGFLCLKRGNAKQLSGSVKQEWYRNCSPFLKDTIDAVAAPVVITLGVRAYHAVANAYGLRPEPFREAVERALALQLGERRRAFAVFHPAARPVSRSHDKMRDDWLRIRSSL